MKNIVWTRIDDRLIYGQVRHSGFSTLMQMEVVIIDTVWQKTHLSR